jgi:hypothetical protein
MSASPGPDPSKSHESKKPEPPTSEARDYIRYVVGFSVAVTVGLAPYLGKAEVPGFAALLTLVPEDLHDTAFPLSAALMGAVAVGVQWMFAGRPSRSRLDQLFKRAGMSFIASLFVFIVVNTFVVERIYVGATQRTEAFLIGWQRPDQSPCAKPMSNANCIKRLLLDRAEIRGFWGDTQVRTAQLALIVSYLGTTGSFGALIGLLLVRGSLKAKETPQGNSNSGAETGASPSNS